MKINKVVLSLCGLAVLATGLWMYFRGRSGPPNLAAVAANLDDAISKQDAGRIVSLISSEERKALDLDESKVQKLLDSFYTPQLRGFNPKQEADVRPFPYEMLLSRQKTLVNEKGAKAELGLFVQNTEEGVTGQDVVFWLVASGLNAQLASQGKTNRGLEGLRNRREALVKEMDTLRATGVPGVVISDNIEATRQVLTWEQFLAFLDKKIAKVEKRTKELGQRAN
jgi:hypothetical protein